MKRFKKGDLAIIVFDSDLPRHKHISIEGAIVEIWEAGSFMAPNGRLYDYRVSPPNPDWVDCHCMDYELRPIGGIGDGETNVEVKIEELETA